MYDHLSRTLQSTLLTAYSYAQVYKETADLCTARSLLEAIRESSLMVFTFQETRLPVQVSLGIQLVGQDWTHDDGGEIGRAHV